MSDGKISRYVSHQREWDVRGAEFYSAPINLDKRVAIIFDNMNQLESCLRYLRTGKNDGDQELYIHSYYTDRDVIVNGEPMKLVALIGEVQIGLNSH